MDSSDLEIMTSFGLPVVLFLVLLLIFTLLSRMPGNNVVYYPTRIYSGMEAWEGGRRPRNPFSWIREALSSTEQDVITMCSVDSAVYFVFLNTVLRILVFAGLLLLPILLPMAVTDGSAESDDSMIANAFIKLSMGHVKEGSPRLWAFLIATYCISFNGYYLLWNAYKHVSDLRVAALMSPEVRVEEFTVLVRDIPPPPEGQTRQEQVDSHFKSIYPDTFYRSMVVTNNKEVNKLWKKLKGYKKELAGAEAIYAKSMKTGKPEGIRPTNRTGFLGLIGKKVYSIEYYNKKINELNPKLEAERKVTLREKQQASALVFFTSRVAAASAAQSLHAHISNTWTAMGAPKPRQLIWANLPMSFYKRLTRLSVVYVIFAVTTVFSRSAIVHISALEMPENLWKPIKTLLNGFIPQTALMIFLLWLKKFYLFLSEAEGNPSVSHVQRAASGKYYLSLVLIVSIEITAGGTLFHLYRSNEIDANTAFSLLAENIPVDATFWLSYGALGSCADYGKELSRLYALIIYHLKRKYLCKTEAELEEAWAPQDHGFANRVPDEMVIVTVILWFSVIAPIGILFGVLYFGLGWLVLRNQVLKVYGSSAETYGRMWPHIHTRFVAALFFCQVTMFGYFMTKKFSYSTLILIPLPIMSLIFAHVCRMKFYHFFRVTALEAASHELEEAPNMELVFRSFIPPSLIADEAEEDQFEDNLAFG